MEIAAEKLEWLERVSFGAGSHQPPTGEPGDGEACFAEAVSYIAGEPWSDRPECVSPVIAAFVRGWNDSLPNADRTRLLKPLVLKTLGTRSTPEVEHRRSLLALDWLIRTHTAAWLDLTEKLKPHAEALRSLPELSDLNAGAAGEKVRAAGDAAWAAAQAAAHTVAQAAAQAAVRTAAWDASGDAAQTATRAAAQAAVRTAAPTAARAAAQAAAQAAVRTAAPTAAHTVARAALRETVTQLQESAVALVELMCAMGEEVAT